MKFSILFLCLLFNTILFANTVSYNRDEILWMGRWNEEVGVGKWSGWEGSYLSFNIHGTKYIEINALIEDLDLNASCAITVSIDKSKVDYYYYTNDYEIFNGARKVSIQLPDTNIHNIVIHTAGDNASLFYKKTKTIIQSIDFESTGYLKAGVEISKNLMAIGDSWMACESDFILFMDKTRWNIFPIASGGLKIFNAVFQFEYDYFDHKSNDPTFDGVIIAFGVNDFISNLSTSEFDSYLKILIDKIHQNQKGLPIYLIQIPKNKDLENDYGIYGSVMNRNANKFKNVYYISTRSIESRLSWNDNYHLDLKSRMIMAGYVDSCINNYEMNGEPIPSIYYSKQNIFNCDNNIYNFNGHSYTNSGIYKDTLESVYGCDSIVQTELVVLPTYTQNQTIRICKGESYKINGHNYSNGGNYLDTLSTIHGCDSIVQTELVVLPTCTQNQTIRICKGESYKINGHNYSIGGNYIDTLSTIHGCDSIVQTELVVLPTYTQNQTIRICKGESYKINGYNYSIGGNYIDTLSTIHGCDSIVQTELVVLPTYTQNQTIRICKGESYKINGHNYSIGGNYIDTLSTIHGCDSVIQSNVIVSQSYFAEITKTFFVGERFDFNGHIYSKEGLYIDTLTSESGCDSIIHTQLYFTHSKINVFPNPVLNKGFNVEFYNKEQGDVELALYDINGLLISQVYLREMDKGIVRYTFGSIKNTSFNGLIFLKLIMRDAILTKKILIQ